MKCILNKDGSIDRVSDGIAHSKVTSGQCLYVSKTEWKKHIYGFTGKKPEEVVEKPEPTKGLGKAEKQKIKRKKYEQNRKEMLNTQHKKK